MPSLTFQALTGEVVWEVPSTAVPMTDVECKALPCEVFTKMKSFVREGPSEASLYPRICNILVETLSSYRSLLDTKVEIHPSLTFADTDKSTDFALVSITTVSTVCV